MLTNVMSAVLLAAAGGGGEKGRAILEDPVLLICAVAFIPVLVGVIISLSIMPALRRIERLLERFVSLAEEGAMAEEE